MPTRGPTTAHRPRRTATAAPRRPPRAGRARPARRRSDPETRRRATRTPCRAHRAGDPADPRAGRASAGTADADRRTPAPSRTEPRSRAPPETPRRDRRGTRAALSCRPPPPRAPPALDSHPPGRPPATDPASRTRMRGPATRHRSLRPSACTEPTSRPILRQTRRSERPTGWLSPSGNSPRSMSAAATPIHSACTSSKNRGRRCRPRLGRWRLTYTLSRSCADRRIRACR